MEWNTERPAERGFYWMRIEASDRAPEVVEINGREGELRVYMPGQDYDRPLSSDLFDKALWSERLAPPPV